MPINNTAAKKPGKHLMGFKEFIKSPQYIAHRRKKKVDEKRSSPKPLKEVVGDPDQEIATSIFCVVHQGAADEDSSLQILAQEIKRMSVFTSVAISVVPFRMEED